MVDLLNGYNGTIFAYGQTGAGKSFTMYILLWKSPPLYLYYNRFGPDVETQPQLRGIIPRSIAYVHIQLINQTYFSQAYF